MNVSKLIGRVNVFAADDVYSYVTLKEFETGKVFDSNTITAKLKEAGITKAGDEFEILITTDANGKQTGVIKKLEPLEITPEQMTEIVDEVDRRLGTGDDFSI